MLNHKPETVFGLRANAGWSLIVACYIFVCFIGWLGLANEDLIARQMYTGEVTQEFYFKPYFSEFIASILFYIVGVAGLSFLGLVVIPATILIILMRIFGRHLNPEWSIFLALLSVSSFENYPLRLFLVDLVQLDLNFLGKGTFPIIATFPIPSLPMLYFVGLFWLTTSNFLAYPGLVKTVVITVFFSGLAYISAIDLVLAATFWAIFVPMRWLRRGWSSSKIAAGCALNAIVATLLIYPALAMGQIDESLPRTGAVSIYSLFVYFIMPLTLTGVLTIVQKVDPRELIFSFGSLYALMAAEGSVLAASSLGLFPIDISVFQSRSPQFFAHALYYVPVIYLASRSSFPGSVGSERLWLSVYIREHLSSIFVTHRTLVSGVLVVLLLGYNAVGMLGLIFSI